MLSFVRHLLEPGSNVWPPTELTASVQTAAFYSSSITFLEVIRAVLFDDRAAWPDLLPKIQPMIDMYMMMHQVPQLWMYGSIMAYGTLDSCDLDYPAREQILKKVHNWVVFAVFHVCLPCFCRQMSGHLSSQFSRATAPSISSICARSSSARSCSTTRRPSTQSWKCFATRRRSPAERPFSITTPLRRSALVTISSRWVTSLAPPQSSRPLFRVRLS